MNESVYVELQEKFICVHSRDELMTGGDILVIPSFSLHGVEVDPLVSYERIIFNVRDDFVVDCGSENTDNMLPSLVAETCRYVEEHLNEKIIVSELSKELHHNKDYVNRCFKKEMGTSLKEYILSRMFVKYIVQSPREFQKTNGKI